jgi:hypothetical protein
LRILDFGFCGVVSYEKCFIVCMPILVGIKPVKFDLWNLGGLLGERRCG